MSFFFFFIVFNTHFPSVKSGLTEYCEKNQGKPRHMLIKTRSSRLCRCWKICTLWHKNWCPSTSKQMSANGCDTSCSKGSSPWTWKSSSTGHQTCFQTNKGSIGFKRTFFLLSTVCYQQHYHMLLASERLGSATKSDHRYLHGPIRGSRS